MGSCSLRIVVGSVGTTDSTVGAALLKHLLLLSDNDQPFKKKFQINKKLQKSLFIWFLIDCLTQNVYCKHNAN